MGPPVHHPSMGTTRPSLKLPIDQQVDGVERPSNAPNLQSKTQQDPRYKFTIARKYASISMLCSRHCQRL